MKPKNKSAAPTLQRKRLNPKPDATSIRPPGPAGYGSNYYGIRTGSEGTLYFYADILSVSHHGDLVALANWPRRSGKLTPTLVWRAGMWDHVFAASATTGEAVAVDSSSAA